MRFEFTLHEGRVKPHQVKALHLMSGLAMDGAGAVLFMFMPPVKYWSLSLMIFGVLLLGISIFFSRWIRRPLPNTIFRVIELLIFGWLVGYFIMQEWLIPTVMYGVLGLTILFALFWEQRKGQVQKIVIDDSGLKLPVALRKRNSLQWQEVEQALLRFGVLTIDCVDNRLFQWNIDATDIDQETFESYCRQKIEEGKAKRVADW